MPIIKNTHRNDLVKSLDNLANSCSTRSSGENGDAFTNFQIYFTLKKNSISSKTFSDSENNILDDFKVKVDHADLSVKKSGGQGTINELNQLKKELGEYFK